MKLIVPLPSLSLKLKWEGPFLYQEATLMKQSLTPQEHVDLLKNRGLVIADEAECIKFFESHSYYGFSGYARYFQVAPRYGDDRYTQGAAFDAIRDIYQADSEVRSALMNRLSEIELLLRTFVARIIADDYSPYSVYLDPNFYSGDGESVIKSCERDLDRSKDRNILHFRDSDAGIESKYKKLPIWSAVEAFSFGTLSKIIEHGDGGKLNKKLAASLNVASSGFAYRIRALVYLRNRCAHHDRLWNHSVIDAGPTPNNVRSKAKKLTRKIEPRSIIDIVASMDNISARAGFGDEILPQLYSTYSVIPRFWGGLASPETSKDHK